MPVPVISNRVITFYWYRDSVSEFWLFFEICLVRWVTWSVWKAFPVTQFLMDMGLLNVRKGMRIKCYGITQVFFNRPVNKSRLKIRRRKKKKRKKETRNWATLQDNFASQIVFLLPRRPWPCSLMVVGRPTAIPRGGWTDNAWAGCNADYRVSGV